MCGTVIELSDRLLILALLLKTFKLINAFYIDDLECRIKVAFDSPKVVFMLQCLNPKI